MATISQAAIAASLIVGLMAVPAASKSIVNEKSFEADLPNVSSSGEMPEEVTESVTEDSYSRKVKTAFSQFTSSISHDKVKLEMENPGNRLEVRKKPGGNVWKLETSSGTLEIEETSGGTVETVTTPEGKLKVIEEMGGRREEFSGSDRDSVEETRNELLQLMKEKKKAIEEKRSRMVEENRPDVDIVIDKELAESPEKVILENNGMEEVSLQGWTIADESSEYSFGERVIEPGERLHVYSAEEREIQDPDVPAVFDTGIAWNDDGDTATLEAPDYRVDEESY